jgi:hypothetical protein
MKEIWKPIKGYEGRYEVSNLGRVKSLDRKSKNKATPEMIVKGRLIKDCNTNGYRTLRLSLRNVPKMFYVHRLVCSAFVENPNNKKTVNHIDGDKTNNHYSNLEWTSLAENIRHANKAGLRININRKTGKQLTKKQALELIELLNKGCKNKDIAKEYNISLSSVYNIKAGKQWPCLFNLIN